jgi:hypothetical protein
LWGLLLMMPLLLLPLPPLLLLMAVLVRESAEAWRWKVRCHAVTMHVTAMRSCSLERASPSAASSSWGSWFSVLARLPVLSTV